MTFVYNEAKKQLLTGGINWTSDDIRVALVMTNTTADTEDDVNFMNGFTTLDEMDGAAYARVAIANEAVNEDATNNRAEADGDNVQFAGVGAGTRNVQGVIVYKHVTNDTDSIPIIYFDGFTAFAGNGGNIDITWNAEGILQAA